MDLGAQYPVSRLSLCFFHNPPWAQGGRLEIAAIPDTYSTVYDSGVWHQFGTSLTPCEEYSVPSQPVRYIRTTDYFIPGVGPSQLALWSVQAFTQPAPLVAYFPASPDNLSFSVNLLRRPASVAQPTVSVAYANGALPGSFAPQRSVANMLDGDDTIFGWETAAANPDATATLTIDLGQVQSIGAIHPQFFRPSLSFSLRAAQTLGDWTQVLADTPISVSEFIAPFPAISARYLELTLKGTPATRGVYLYELGVFPSSVTDPAPSSTSQLDLTYLTGATLSADSNMQKIPYPLGRVADALGHVQRAGFAGRTIATGATGDGVITLDLGNQYAISQIGVSFFGQATWPGGGKVEIDDGSGTWTTMFDSGRGTAFGVPDGTQAITFSQRPARSIRTTDYFVPGVGTSTGILGNIEVF